MKPSRIDSWGAKECLRKCILIMTSGLCLFAAQALTQTSTSSNWPDVTTESRPWTRWWWLGSAVTKAEITEQLEVFRDAGLGGVEITPLYGVKGEEAHYIDFLSPQWVAMLKHVAQEAQRLGLGVDMVTGTGWPFGGPNVPQEMGGLGFQRSTPPPPPKKNFTVEPNLYCI